MCFLAQFVKCGFAGDNIPRCTFPAIVGRPVIRAEEASIDDGTLKVRYCSEEHWLWGRVDLACWLFWPKPRCWSCYRTVTAFARHLAPRASCARRFHVAWLFLRVLQRGYCILTSLLPQVTRVADVLQFFALFCAHMRHSLHFGPISHAISGYYDWR